MFIDLLFFFRTESTTCRFTSIALCQIVLKKFPLGALLNIFHQPKFPRFGNLTDTSMYTTTLLCFQSLTQSSLFDVFKRALHWHDMVQCNRTNICVGNAVWWCQGHVAGPAVIHLGVRAVGESLSQLSISVLDFDMLKAILFRT
eukprot:SAG31_NODE_1772_length_7306_cov_3.341335_8_plen_144_part_00